MIAQFKKSSVLFNPELIKLLKTARSFKEVHPKPHRADRSFSAKVSIRVSKKQLFFYAFRSQELTGAAFEKEGGVDYPTAFKVGEWEDGSEHWARCSANTVNGPYWVTFTTYFLEPSES